MGDKYSQTPYGDFWTDSGTNFLLLKNNKDHGNVQRPEIRYFPRVVISIVEVGIAAGDFSTIFKTPEFIMRDHAAKQDSISLYLTYARPPALVLNNSPTVLKNIKRDASETIKSRMQGYDSKPSLLAL